PVSTLEGAGPAPGRLRAGGPPGGGPLGGGPLGGGPLGGGPLGRPVPAWEPLRDAVDELGPAELRLRAGEAARLLDADGVVVNLDPPAGQDRPRPAAWPLDPLPAIVSSRDWVDIEAGVAERAELLSLVLEDLYGDRRLLARRVLPAELVLGSPGFLRAVSGMLGAGREPGGGDGAGAGRGPGRPGRALFAYAVDLARDADGRVVALADHCEVPEGVGYALADRQVVAKVLPTLHREARVHRLAPFVRALRSGLQMSSATALDDPRIVVLGAGPLARTAFEPAMLAATLGYPLVGGRDLLVRKGRVWIRSVGQLEPVDTILRWVPSSLCDPLELRGDSQLGVPGLLEVLRDARVSVVNPVGAGILEHPALMAFLPRLGRHLLGREPSLASRPTWWCGEPPACAHVLAQLDALLVRSLRSGATHTPAQLTASARADLVREIRARPGEWVAQGIVDGAEIPVLQDGDSTGAPAWLRSFAVREGDGYAVMPGGLTQVGTPPTGGAEPVLGSRPVKDTWVLTSEPEPLAGFWLQPGPIVTGVDPLASVPAGAAQTLWWLGRHAERAEALTRLMRVRRDRVSEFGGTLTPGGRACLDALEDALGALGGGDPGPALRDALGDLLDHARAVRDQLSRDTWLVLGPLERLLAPGASPPAPGGEAPGRDGGTGAVDADADAWGGGGGAGAFGAEDLSLVMTSLLAFGGLGVESMVRDLGWRFMDAGRRLERSLGVVSLLAATLTRTRDTATDSLLLESVLSAAESIITYRFRYRSQAQPETVLELLLLDEGNPRSLSHQLQRLDGDLEALPDRGGSRRSPARRRVLEAVSLVALAEPRELCVAADDGRRPELAGLLGRLEQTLSAAAVAVEAEHFHFPAPSFSRTAPSGTGRFHGRGRADEHAL
ncbi:MAG TPA: circularly permuted type 2 ATP-grasp protein, partial [Solirubrobacteraceae bacterium]|nr:circularly permuted type 2 ATP-grasp protein [Solirubrobacteraceae bacterium]